MSLNIIVGIPTVGRAAVLREVLIELGRQARRADAVIVCGTTEADIAGAADICGARVMLAAPGLPRQRNAIIAAAAEADIMLFFDDDFLADPDYIAAIERHFEAQPSTVVATGQVLADGINGPGLSPNEGRAILRRPDTDGVDATVFTGYGCNMALRLAPMRAHGLHFDERLPLYAWQEDVDLSRRLAPYGDIVKLATAKGVHLGVKVGRGKGVRLGYSQVANPLYLCGKRHGYPLAWALRHIAANLAMNVAKSLMPEPYVDRRGRLFGNILAIRDLASGRMAPERILQL
jgi:GT2 family glycosyltransferase